MPARSMYSRRISVSMISARVAGVPRPRSFIASRSSSSSTSLPAVSIAGEQRRLGVARRRLRLLRLALGLDAADLLALLERGQLALALGVLVLLAASVVGLDAVDAAPARLERDLAAGAEALALDLGDDVVRA